MSVSSAGRQGNGHSDAAAISGNGRFVTFASEASNLVPNDRNRVEDIFIRDLRRGVTERVSVTSRGGEANDFSWQPSVSADGRFVAFTSSATNLGRGDENEAPDIFVHDRASGRTELISAALDGTTGSARSEYPSISPDGRWVSFTSLAQDLVSEDSDQDCQPTPQKPKPGCVDVFLRDRARDRTSMVSVATSGQQGNDHSSSSVVSSDGRFVAFLSGASNLDGKSADAEGWGLLLRDTKARTTTAMVESSKGFVSGHRILSISPNGRYIGFVSAADDLVKNDDNQCHVGYGDYEDEYVPCEDAFLYDRREKVLSLISRTSRGQPSDHRTFDVAISADARWVVFSSSAGNLFPGPHPPCSEWENCPDVFVRDRVERRTTLVSHARR